jgi:glycosyltransferase involved in cell wall biosynthesis
VTVGSVTYRKGQINVIKALPVLIESFPDIHYHIIGLEAEKQQLLVLARELGVESRITFHGALSNDELKLYLQVADIFVMLSNHDPSGDFEGFGIAVLEANHMGLPAIGSEDSGLRDAIHAGYSGRLINPKNPRELQLAIQDILANHTQYKIQAREHATHFVWERVIQKYIAVLSSQ